MKNRHRITAYSIGAAFVLIVGLTGCQSGSDDYPADGTLPTVKLDIRRTELDLQRLGASYRKDSTAQPLSLFNAHMDTAFFADMFPVDGKQVTEADRAREVVRFAADAPTQALVDTVLRVFPDEASITRLLEKPLQRILTRWDTIQVPAVRTYITGYQEPGQLTMDPGFLDEQYLALGLHYFLGPELPFYPRDLPRYYRRRFQPAYLPIYVADLFRVVHGLQADPPRGKRLTLAERAVYEGIRLEYLAEICRETPDSIRHVYSAAQTQWLRDNEPVVYQRMLPLLFSQDVFGYSKLVEEAPNTTGLPPEAPGRAGQYFGWRVVRAWRQKHPDVSLQALMRRTDYLTIFQESGYKP